MEDRDIVLRTLSELKIPYDLREHRAYHTVEECLETSGIDWSQTEICKNVFLCNRQETEFHLFILRHDISFRTSVVSKALGVSRLSFAGEEHLMRLLRLRPGAVTPLALLFDGENCVRFSMDEGLMAFPYLAFHPCVNTETVVMRREDFFNVYLPRTAHGVTSVSLS